MKEYFYADGQNHLGPFKIEELKNKNITRETLVWCEGMSDWKKASDIVELKILFPIAPPPIKPVPPPPISNNEKSNKQNTKEPKNNKFRNIALSLLALLIVGIAVILLISYIKSNSSNSSSSSSSSKTNNPSITFDNSNNPAPVQKTEAELKADLKATEESNPAKYLKADGTYKPNFMGDKFKVSCSITNNASIATFKDAVVKVTYYTKTNTVIRTNQYIVYELFPPNKTKTVQMTIDNYQNVNTIGWDVVKATVVNN